jgi:UDP-glucose-4-epimerase GalE
MSKCVLVTGGAGFIGSHTVKALHVAGIKPIVFDNLSTGHEWAAKWGIFIRGDLENKSLLQDIFETNDIDAVIHFAANAYVGESMQNPGKYFRNNVANTLNLLEIMQAKNVKNIVFSSSCTTYGIPEQLPITENAPQVAISPYGESKLMCERLLKWYEVCHQMRPVILRYFNASGADSNNEIGEDHDPETHLVPLVIGAALNHYPPIQIFGDDYPTPDGTAIRDYVHVSDLADAHVKAVQHLFEGKESLAVNLGSGHGSSVLEVIRTVERITGRSVPFKLAARRAGDPAILVADSSKALEKLGWKPSRNLDEIVETAWRWHERSWATSNELIS